MKYIIANKHPVCKLEKKSCWTQSCVDKFKWSDDWMFRTTYFIATGEGGTFRECLRKKKKCPRSLSSGFLFDLMSAGLQLQIWLIRKSGVYVKKLHSVIWHLERKKKRLTACQMIIDFNANVAQHGTALPVRCFELNIWINWNFDLIFLKEGTAK
jgi:hypothetical protein